MILDIRKARKTYGGLVAVNDVDLTVKERTIHAVIGPNGAGKTTFFNGITAVDPFDQGNVVFDNHAIEHLPTHKISKLGIARTFQNIRLFPFMTVLENVKVGTHNLTHASLASVLARGPRFKREEAEVEEHCLDLLRQVGLLEERDSYARNLAYGAQRRLEIARAMASRPKVLLLDEPAAGMNTVETAELDEFIRLLTEKGYTIVLIEHDMKLVMSVADSITVIDHGVKIAEGTAEEVQNDEKVIEAYLGKRRD